LSVRISVFGLGYVGTVTMACFAHMGHHVTGVDVSQGKVEMLASGRSPIVEAQVGEMIAAAHSEGRLQATTNAAQAICNSDVTFVCVGTPSLRSGQLDLHHLDKVAHEIGAALAQKKSHHTVTVRSTVLPGTTESLVIPALERASGRKTGHDFAICYNPEFMREGSAVADFLQPPYTILGVRERVDSNQVRELYQSIPGTVFEASIPVAEMVKYVCNAYHAVKVDFANEIGTLCKQLGVDTHQVTQIFTSDTKLNVSKAYLSPGFAFGGSCLPKDLRALSYRAKQLDLSLPLLEAVIPSNTEHVQRAIEAILQTNRKKLAILGLSFKAGTDDLRESPQVRVIKQLLGEGCSVRIWDPDVSLGKLTGANRQYIEEVIPHIGSLLVSDLVQAIDGAEVVILGTRVAKRELISGLLKQGQIVIDLIHLDPSSRPAVADNYEGICW
jgi:GDP-mannose 6-dehydrogenase